MGAGSTIQLIQFLLFSIQVYWSSIFILPIMRNFLWTGLELKGHAKISSQYIFEPKIWGGLGFKCLIDWNKAAILKNIWALSMKADILCVKWIHTYVINSQCFWYMSCPSDMSWTMRKIFKLRSIVVSLIKKKIGNGDEHVFCLIPFFYLSFKFMKSILNLKIS